jgi:hypothetical protein
MKRSLAVLSVVSLLAIGCSNPTAPISGKLSVTPSLDCGSNTNNSNNPPATAGGGCGENTNNNNNNNNNPPTTAKQP